MIESAGSARRWALLGKAGSTESVPSKSNSRALISIEVTAHERGIVAEVDGFLTRIRYEEVEVSGFAKTELDCKLQPDPHEGAWNRCCGALYVQSMGDRIGLDARVNRAPRNAKDVAESYAIAVVTRAAGCRRPVASRAAACLCGRE